MLSRKVGQSIMIADNVRVTVVGIQGNKVRLGIVAPEGTSVDRLEIHGLKKAQRKKKLEQASAR